ncbi:MAG: 4Fe-4S binding protein, partial [Deltaproteobacteria bacterium]|nr:4Fe-4S binding protein [Deltaproteobacteria bacterium]
MPAILASGVIAALVFILSAFVFGRIYCSIICPLGVFQDIAGSLAGKKPGTSSGNLGKKPRFRYRPGKTYLRAAILAIFIAAWFFGLPVVWNALEPYSAFGRIASGLFSPLWALGHNGLAYLSEITGIFWISTSPIWIKGLYAFGLGLLTFAVVVYLALRNGRAWCNTVCPVGTALGVISRFSIFAVRINQEKCSKCSICEKSCKCSCLDSKSGTIDGSRCVVCLNCLEACRYGAMAYARRKTPKPANNVLPTLNSADRRRFIISS